MDVVTLGESMVLFTPDMEGPLRFAGGFRKTIGGAETNVAIALSRLGHQTGWISRLGNDEFGRYVRNFIRGEGVDTSRVLFDDHAPTAVFFKELVPNQDPKIYYYRKNSAASTMTPEDLDPGYIKEAKYLHLTGITPALSSSCKETVFHAIEIARLNAQKVVFDPNVRLKLWSKAEAKQVLSEIAEKVDILLPGIEEGELLTGESDPEKIASVLLRSGPETVVIKLGEDGAYYATQNERRHIPGYKVEKIVDTAGAGDGFAAGFLSGLIRGWTHQEAVKLGNRVGAFALTVPGDTEGYPFWKQVDPNSAQSEVLR